MSVKSNYFKLTEDDFSNYLTDLKNSSNTIFLLDRKYFFNQSLEISNMILQINKMVFELDMIINSFSEFSKKQILQSFLIDEIESTNKIESIYSAKHDIFKVINDASFSKDKKIISISNAYKQLLESKRTRINTNNDIRKLYDIVLKDSIDKNDLPDGKYYRHNPVYITDGMKSIHTGVSGEENINKLMNEFICLYNSNNDLFIKMILSHFILEYVHPFYDGNGRLGRFLLSNGFYFDLKNYFAFTISSSLLHEKNRYYKAFKEANDQYEFGCLNTYVKTILSIFINQTELLIKKLNLDKEKLNIYTSPFKMTKSEEKVYKLISETSIFSTFGISNEEIIKGTQVSKRTLINTLNKFKEMNILEDTKIGKFDYHKIKN